MLNQLSGWMLLCALLLVSTAAPGQIFEANQQRVDSEFVRQNMCFAAFAYPQAINEHKTMELLPREIITAWGQKMFGFDPMTIKQIALLVENPESLDNPPNYLIVVGFDEIQGLGENMLAEMQQGTLGGKMYYKSRNRMIPNILVFDERTLIFGPDEYLRKAIAQPTMKEGLAAIIRQSKLNGEVRAFLDMDSVRPLVKSQLEQVPRMLPPVLLQMLQIPDLVNAVEFAIKIDDGFRSRIVFHTVDDDAAGKLKSIVDDALEFSRQMSVAQMQQQVDPNDPVQVATLQYVNRVGEYFQTRLSPEQNGNQVGIVMQNEVAAIPVLIGMLLPAVQQTRAAARRVDGANRARQFAISMHNYHDVHKRFPAQANFDDNGKPLLSWRVHVLPFIEQQELYEQFRLDEPWDSPHNRKLIEKMPEIFQSPSATTRPGRTVYLGIAGEGAMFDGNRGLRLQDMRDGTSNTAILVEADASEAVIWTKPEDYKVDPNNPLRGLGGLHPAGFNVTYADGSVRLIERNIDPETWKAIITHSGGESVNRR